MTARATEDEDITQQVYEFNLNMDTSESEPFIQYKAVCISPENFTEGTKIANRRSIPQPPRATAVLQLDPPMLPCFTSCALPGAALFCPLPPKKRFDRGYATGNEGLLVVQQSFPFLSSPKLIVIRALENNFT